MPSSPGVSLPGPSGKHTPSLIEKVRRAFKAACGDGFGSRSVPAAFAIGHFWRLASSPQTTASG